MMQFGMPTLIENHTLEENIDHTIDIVTMM